MAVIPAPGPEAGYIPDRQKLKKEQSQAEVSVSNIPASATNPLRTIPRYNQKSPELWRLPPLSSTPAVTVRSSLPAALLLTEKVTKALRTSDYKESSEAGGGGSQRENKSTRFQPPSPTAAF